MIKYALVGDVSGKTLTWMGRIITHTNREELEFLVKGAKVVRVNIVNADDELPIQFHPRFEGVRFPLRREDFR